MYHIFFFEPLVVPQETAKSPNKINFLKRLFRVCYSIVT